MSVINVAIVGTTVLTSLVESGDSVNVSIGSAVAGTTPLVTAGTIQIGNTTTLNTGQNATVTNKGSGIAAVLDFGIPRGPAGVTPTLEIGLVSAVAAGANAGVVATSANGGGNVTLDFFLPVGQSPSFAIGNVATLNAGSNATVNLASANNGANVSLSFGLPRGADGQNGVSPNLTIGNVTTLNAGLNATVNATTSNNGANVTLDFGLPRGAAGTSPTLAVGKVTTLNAGLNATVNATTSNDGANVTLDFGLPRGADGTANLNLSNDAPANLGTAAAGTSNLAARADHVHATPIIDYANLSNTPTNFPTNATLVSGLAEGYAAINHSHNYVTAINGLTGAISLVAGTNVTITTNTSNLTIDSKAGLGANDAVDGGTYTGTILGGITFTVQPQSQTVSTSSNITFANVANSPARYGVSASAAGLLSLAAYPSSTVGTELVTANLLLSTNDGSTWSSVGNVQFYANLAQSPVEPYGRPSALSNGTRTVMVPGVVWQALFESLTFEHPGVLYSDSANMAGFVPVGTGYSGSFSFNARPYSLAYSDTAGRWVVSTSPTAGQGTGTLWSSSDGANWTQRRSREAWQNDSAIRVVSVNGLFVAMCNTRAIWNPSTSVYVVQPYVYSSTGVTWTENTNPFPRKSGYGNDSDPSAVDIASSGTRAVAIRDVDVRYTSDGTTWGSATLPVACYRIEYARNLFWAFGAGTDVCTSADGVTWTLRSRTSTSSVLGLAAADGSNIAFLLQDGSTHATATVTGSAASANFTVSATASGNAVVSYQWQRSLDAGSTWTNIASATASALNLTGLTTANSAERYRALASATGAATKNSQSATLTVTE